MTGGKLLGSDLWKKNFRHNVQRKSMEKLNGNEQITCVSYNLVTRILHKKHRTLHTLHMTHVTHCTQHT